MKTKQLLIVVVLAALAAVVAACSPAGQGQEPSAADEARPESMEVTELEGTRWILVSYVNAAGETVQALADREATLEFAADGNLGGNAGCNQFFAAYTVDGNNISVGEAGSTLMACDPPEAMQQEADFLSALQSASTYVVSGDELQLVNADGEVVATLSASKPASLTGTTWTAVTYNTGTEAVTNTMEGTTITANFTEAGELNGSAGCNNYMGTYTIDGQNITIGPLATTRKLCPEPAGVMEQEAAFVSMMSQASTFTISGDKLELRTADGALIASFTAAQ